MNVAGGRSRVVAAVALVALAAVLAPSPARAGIESVEPTSAVIAPGDRLRITVWTESSTFLCLTASAEPPEPNIALAFDVPCAIGRWRARLTVATTPALPLGTYRVLIGDGSAVFEVPVEVVAEPPPTTTVPGTTTEPPPPTEPPPSTSPTTAPPAPTTTGPPLPTTTAAGPTTSPPGPTTTAPTGATTTAPGGGAGGPGGGDAGTGAGGTGADGSGGGADAVAGPGVGGPAEGTTRVAGIAVERDPAEVDARVVLGRPDGGTPAADELAAPGAPVAATAVAAFRPLAGLARVAPPPEGLFLPFRAGPAAGRCLPLAAACRLGDGGLVLAPPATLEVRWDSAPDDLTRLPPLGGRGVPPLQPVGVVPDGFAAVNFLLPVLDLGAGNGQVKGLPRGLDGGGAFGPPATGRRAVPPVVEGGDVPAAGARPLLASPPFERPYRLRAEALVEAFPAVVVFSGRQPTPLFGLRTDPSWDLEVSFVPLLGIAAPPFLGRTDDGATGLYVTLPAGVEASDQPPLDASGPPPRQPEGQAEGEARSGLGVPLLLPLGLLVVGGAVVAWWRRRRAGPV